MFILCPQCQFLVAIDASGLPPARCPRCGHALRADDTTADTPTGRAPVAPVPATVREPEGAAPAFPDDEVAAPANAMSVDVDALAEASVTATAEADWAAELAPPAPPSETASPASVSALAAPSKPEEPDEPEKAGKAGKAGKITKLRKPAKAAKPTPPENGTREKPAKRAKHAKAAKPAPEAPVDAPQHDGTLRPASVAPSARRNAPSFAQSRVAPATGARWPAVATLAGLALLLALQLLLADRARLASDARWRPAIASLCGVLRCTLPSWHEPEAFALVARDVRPARSGVLRVSATFRNDARWTQAWPALHLALQDVDGRTVGARVFAPSEYLRGHETQNGLAPGQVATIAFDIDEPAGTVVAFTFDFR